MIRNVARCTCEIKPRIAMATTAFNNNNKSFYQQIGLKCKEELVKWYIWSVALCGADTGTLRKLE
jgi:hypothetical protein